MLTARLFKDHTVLSHDFDDLVNKFKLLISKRNLCFTPSWLKRAQLWRVVFLAVRDHGGYYILLAPEHPRCRPHAASVPLRLTVGCRHLPPPPQHEDGYWEPSQSLAIALRATKRRPEEVGSTQLHPLLPWVQVGRTPLK